ncbi:MAG: hypothetical protein C0433_08105 [Cyclobacterium sp.]|nr:hypothetical protein [Cyclobacterium sp.]
MGKVTVFASPPRVMVTMRSQASGPKSILISSFDLTRITITPALGILIPDRIQRSEKSSGAVISTR